MNDDDFPKGKGDPDFYGYPKDGSKPKHIKYIGEDKAVVQVQYEPRNRREFPSLDYDARFDEDLVDNFKEE